jgi:hypothetical protein
MAGGHPRVHLHFTPTDSSWLNLVERFIAELTTKWRRRGSHRSVQEVEESIGHWVATWNEDPRPFARTKTAHQLLHAMATYRQRINNSAH